MRIAVQGSGKPLRLNELCLDLSGTDCLSDIQRVHVYYSGQTARSSIRKEIFGSARKPEKMMLYKMDKQGWQLSPGINYFLVTFDLNPEAKSGNILDAKVSYFKLNRKTHFPETDQTCEKKRVTVNSKLHPETFKVLHGTFGMAEYIWVTMVPTGSLNSYGNHVLTSSPCKRRMAVRRK